MSMSTPVTLLIYNRPELTRRALESIRAYRPAHLIIVADGAPHDPREAERCLEARRVLDFVDWPCDVSTDFAATHMGCAARVASGIGHVLSRWPATIVIEDDCVAEPSFFRYADELLERYAADERVFAVSGDNFQLQRPRDGASYSFSRYAHIWGWATWARAWKHYDPSMTDWGQLRDSGWLERQLDGDRGAARYWRRVFDATASGEIDSWAYRWLFACWLHGGLTAVPARNLVSNLGFSPDRRTPFGRIPTRPMDFPLRHPRTVERSVTADRATQKWVFEHPRFFWARRGVAALRDAFRRNRDEAGVTTVRA
jgi:hypothetical protein